MAVVGLGLYTASLKKTKKRPQACHLVATPVMSQFARDRLGHWVNAVTTEQRRGVRYTCDCPGKHKVKLVKPLGLGKRSFRDYFAHVSSGKSKQTKCCANGESEAHRNAKHLLRAMQGSFSFALQQCPDCRAQVIETCGRGVIDVEIASADGRWRYDCLLRVDGRPVLALEVVHTHFSSEEKVASTRADGVALAEFRAEDVMKMQEAGGGWIENLQVLVVLCETCAVKWQAECLAREVAVWVWWDWFVWKHYQQRWDNEEKMRRDQLRREEAEDVLVVIAAEMEWKRQHAQRAIEHAREQASLHRFHGWMFESWELEIAMMGKIDRMWGEWFNYLESEAYLVWLKTWKYTNYLILSSQAPQARP